MTRQRKGKNIRIFTEANILLHTVIVLYKLKENGKGNKPGNLYILKTCYAKTKDSYFRNNPEGDACIK